MTLINSPLNSDTKLKSAIEAIAPKIDPSVLDELCRWTRTKNLKWVSDINGQNAYYLMGDLSVAKDLDSDDYRRNWSSEAKVTTGEKNRPSERLAGKGLKLEGDKLANFKKLYEQQNGVSLGRINSLCVGNFLHAYSYLVQGSSQVAKGFQTLGSVAIETSVKKEIEESSHVIEPDLQKQLIELVAYSNVGFKFEVAILDTFNPGSHRRWDFVERLPRVIKVYELKAHTLSEQEVKTTLVNKKYIELAIEKYPNKSIEFIFTSPKGINWEAKSYIEEVNKDAKKLYPGAKVKVSFIDLQSITERVVNNIVDNSPIESHFWLKKKLETEFTATVAQRTISKLNSSISEAYQTGRLIKKTKVDNVTPILKLKNAKAA
ncbi:hypothetical protein [Nostoc sp. 'Peltigera membranacea cyanobiont' N6]|uniref:hypothetical protein n=1 Tax=Nostoc sp. 'Peltigera membranacea cyanobiont' N6 TaxID=1261031 RepID=UPI000CF3602A|nr:hypothetical protein [Nostoc sp. 'Peltigera membranacea cyanobiont' N6]AVH67046.1 hypothetical protein NPM_5615 [Nostoc sp. 'Peltigera membranacea cyanobiont' N6]